MNRFDDQLPVRPSGRSRNVSRAATRVRAAPDALGHTGSRIGGSVPLMSTFPAHTGLQSFFSFSRDAFDAIGLELATVAVLVDPERTGTPKPACYGSVKFSVRNPRRAKFTNEDLRAKLKPLGFYEVYCLDATHGPVSSEVFSITANLTGAAGVAPVPPPH